MKKRLTAALLVIGAFTFTACQEDAAMEELVDNIELNESMEPDDTPDKPGNSGS